VGTFSNETSPLLLGVTEKKMGIYATSV
jgi:hypothetical protein